VECAAAPKLFRGRNLVMAMNWVRIEQLVWKWALSKPATPGSCLFAAWSVDVPAATTKVEHGAGIRDPDIVAAFTLVVVA